nr:GNAT family N-acetyltransferase [Vibrio ichthyoenteri]
MDFYQSQGFEVTATEAEFNGIRFVPMSLKRSEENDSSREKRPF